MSATQQTKNLKLPYYTESDFTSWADFNTAMDIIDTSYGTTNTDVDTLTANVQHNTNAIADNTKNIGNLNTEMQLQQNTTAALQSTINNQQSNITTLNAGLSAAQNDITSLQSSIGNIPPDISAEIAAIKSKNETQDTAIATAQAEADTATKAAQEAQTEASKIQFQNASGKFTNAIITINGNSNSVNTISAASIISYSGDRNFGRISGKIQITNIPDSIRVNQPQIVINLPKESSDVVPFITQSATVYCDLSSTASQFPAKVESNSGSVDITFYISQTSANATISNLSIYF